jgi:hypothetical protein
MWVYLEPSCPDRSFFAELDDVEINARIRGVLVHGANQNSSPNLILFKGRGRQPFYESARAHFLLIVSISASFMHTCSYVGSWVCTWCPARGHLA